MTEEQPLLWYAVQALSGQENRAREALLASIEREEMQDYFGEILVPQEQVIQNRNGQKRKVTRRSYPGYMFVEMRLSPESQQVVLGTVKITQFIGGGRGRTPPPLSPAEVERIISKTVEADVEARPTVDFEKGETVTVIDGPLTGMTGVVDEVRLDKGKLYLHVQVFGRSTRVEAGLNQVQKA
jgi:transcriptional antiterminator NusG